ncbi:DNA ligase 4 [Sesamum alatum]|uniref:DNA ligase 4 n=1 Tax=Sesamum alatum TaxID=300844 RepID=A0AAE1XMW0_9LAMI|nr:DNA ligase 4 [Sesamum alatum]
MRLWPDVAFDILYVGDTSVIHQSLKERHQLLQKVVKPVAGRLEILVPNGGLNAHRPAGEPCWSLIVHDVDGVERFFKETIENRDEGIVLKDLNSKWEPSDRSGKWLKLKPEYIRAGSDLDVLIIGGYYGSGRRGGEVAQFLVGLAERSASNTHPRRFVSFCRVGTGLSDEELNAVVTKLKPYFRKYEYPKKSPPSFYQVTNNSKERPDVWVESPEKSIMVSITSDIRTIRSEVFAAPYSLRFPRIDRVRYDKPWHECLDVQSFVELVHSSNGTTQRVMDYAVVQEDKPKRVKSSRGGKKNVSVVPSHFIQTDVSEVKGETSIFSKMIFYFVNVPSSHSLDSLHKMVVENGGTFSMNLNNSVTHCIASESKGIKFQAAKRQGDVIHSSWIFDCCSQKKLLPLQPKYFLFLSNVSKKKLEEEIDEFSDSYYLDINVTDLKQILNNIGKAEDSKAIEYYKKKFCPREEWIRFQGCCLYFFHPRKNTSWEVPLELAMRRMKIGICNGGGTVAETLSHATHLVIVSSPLTDMDFGTILNSFSTVEKRLLRRTRLQIVKSQWLEDCFDKDQKLPEESYSLKAQGFLESLAGDSNEDDLTREEYRNLEIGSEDASSSYEGVRNSTATSEKPRIVSLPNRDGKRKRGKPSGTSNRKGKSVVNRRTRPRVGKNPAKIYENESDNGASSDEKEELEVGGKNHGGSEMLKSKGRSSFNQPKRTTRAQIRNKPAKIGGNESDKGASSDEQSMGGDFEVRGANKGHSDIANLLVPEFQKKEAEKDSTSEKGKEAELGVEEHNKPGIRVDEINEVGSGYGGSIQYNDRLEDTVDPVQAMLLNMLPILDTKKVENAIPVSDEVKTRHPDPTPEEEKLPLDDETKPVKKRKVSYKDVANELLKDW